MNPVSDRATSAEVRELCEVVRDCFAALEEEIPPEVLELLAKNLHLAAWLWSRFEASEWKGVHKEDPMNLLN
jgi:hypothetical protein